MIEHDQDICLTGVTKIFRTGIIKKKLGVQDLSFTVPKGEVVGLLGPNGSGKSTTIKMILGFLRPNRGEILVCGIPAHERSARQFIGYLPENPRFQKFLTATDIMHYYGRLLGLTGKPLRLKTEEMLALVRLNHAARERVQGFSKGMNQRLAIAQSLLNQPKLLIFDEPMSGLDPLGRMEIRKLIQQIHEEMPSTTIFFSSHILADVEELCSSVALLKKGHLKTFCKLDSLLEREAEVFHVTVRELSQALREKLHKEALGRMTPLGFSLTIEGADPLVQKLTELRQAGAHITRVESRRRNLEEALFGDKELPVIEAQTPPHRAGAGL